MAEEAAVVAGEGNVVGVVGDREDIVAGQKHRRGLASLEPDFRAGAKVAVLSAGVPSNLLSRTRISPF